MGIVQGQTRLHPMRFKTLNYYALVLVSWGGEHGARVSVAWRLFPVGKLDAAVLF